VAHGYAGCTGGNCGIASCWANYGDCDGLVANGCETDLRTSVTNCGACGNVCPPVANGTPACIGFGYCGATYSISGRVTGAVRQGVIMVLERPRIGTITTTDATGRYTFSGLGNTSYTITPSLPGFTFAPASLSVSVSSSDVTGQDFIAAHQAAGTFTATGSMTSARVTHTATLLASGRVLVAGGWTYLRSCDEVYQSTAELYDPATGGFHTTGGMTVGRASHTATLLPDGTVLVAGGYTATGPTTTAEVYDPATGTFVATGSMTAARVAHAATLLPNGTVLVAGGGPATAELYDPITGTFTGTGSMIAGRGSNTVTLLSSGMVLVAGGGPATAELYDATTGTFAATGSMTVGRAAHTAALLPSGLVVVAGGGPATAELYDPVTGTFGLTGSMSVARLGHEATLLPDGKVLVEGGSTGTSVTATAELYDPTAGTFTVTGRMTVPRQAHTATVLPSGMVLVTGAPPKIVRQPPSADYCTTDEAQSAELYQP